MNYCLLTEIMVCANRPCAILRCCTGMRTRFEPGGTPLSKVILHLSLDWARLSFAAHAAGYKYSPWGPRMMLSRDCWLCALRQMKYWIARLLLSLCGLVSKTRCCAG